MFLSPAVKSQPAPCPKNILRFPVLLRPALYPKKILQLPVVLESPAQLIAKKLEDPVVLFWPAKYP